MDGTRSICPRSLYIYNSTEHKTCNYKMQTKPVKQMSSSETMERPVPAISNYSQTPWPVKRETSLSQNNWLQLGLTTNRASKNTFFSSLVPCLQRVLSPLHSNVVSFLSKYNLSSSLYKGFIRFPLNMPCQHQPLYSPISFPLVRP